jgi:Fe-Mn family superoxide dismutase
MDALEPFMSKETLEYHYGKHHKGYVDKLNALLVGTQHERAPLDELVRTSKEVIFNNAAQVWNHNFFWRCLAPRGGGNPSAELGKALAQAFGSVDAFRRLFNKAAMDKFGSGWTWLARMRDGRLVVRNTDDADNPLVRGDTALLACDVWEHAYYIDYRNNRSAYVDAFWKLVNWKFVEGNLTAGKELRAGPAV